MKVYFPVNCNNEASRWSFCVKFEELLRQWHNTTCAGMKPLEAKRWRKLYFFPKQRVLLAALNDQEVIATTSNFWNPKVPDHVSGGLVNYPPELNMEHEGSRAVFYMGLLKELGPSDRNFVNEDSVSVIGLLQRARVDAIAATLWGPALGDIR